MALGLSDRILAVESGLRKQAQEERRLQDLLDSANERAKLILEAKNQWMDRALKVEEKSIEVALLAGLARTGPLEQIKGVVNLADNERERVVRVIENFRAPGFTGKSREQLLKLIQETK